MAKEETRPWFPAHYDDPDTYAIKAVARGEATDIQQRRALNWIIQTLCGTYDLSYRPDSDRDTAFAEGKRHVGMQIVKLINLKPAQRGNDGR